MSRSREVRGQWSFSAAVFLGSIVLVAGVSAALAACGSTAAAPSVGECPEEELLVKFRPGADPATVSARHGATIRSVISGIDVYVLAVPAGTTAEKIGEFMADPEVEFAEPNETMSVPERPPASPTPCGAPSSPGT